MLLNDLGQKNVMFLENHGFITCGKTVHEAMFYCYHLEQACKTQCAALGAGLELIIPPDSVCRQANIDIMSFEQDLGKRDWEAWVRMVKRSKV
jgi:ribulose-5-phosphate 4-epimerase/fuculose-1-phosphate aldolase